MPPAPLVELHTDQGSVYSLALTTGKSAFELVLFSRQSEAGNSKLELWIILNQSAHPLSYETREADQGITNGRICPAIPTWSRKLPEQQQHRAGEYTHAHKSCIENPRFLTVLAAALADRQSMKCQSLDTTGAGGCRECSKASWSVEKEHVALVLVWARKILWNLQDTQMGIRGACGSHFLRDNYPRRSGALARATSPQVF